jgi:hypothetical protein
LISSNRTNYDRAIHSTSESRQMPAEPEVIYGRERELGLLDSILARGNDQGDAAAQHPLVLIAEDAHWFDRETAEVLMFVGRRFGSDPIVLLAAIRSGFETPLQNAGFRAFDLEGLKPAKARALLKDRFPDLAPQVAERLLAAADGNPLGLIALPSALTREQLVGAAALPDELPLTEQLERAFAAQATELPTDAQTLLLVAAVNDGDGLSESLRAAGVMLGRRLAPNVLSPAISARLLDDDQTRVRLRHPLVRFAIRQAAGGSRRRAAHAVLAQALAGDPDRQIWHRAAASTDPDEDVATALELGADRALQRGSSASAIAALERAGELSEDTARKGLLAVLSG